MSDVETARQELLVSALLGTERHPPALPASNGVLAKFLSRLDPSNPQHYLLHGAAAVSLYRQAGRLPVHLSGMDIPSCEPDDQARCSPAASARLADMLRGNYKDLIPEWLILAGSAHKRVPEELLPELLEWGEAHLNQVDLVLPVLGKRGRWLAKQIPWVENMGSAVFTEDIPIEAAQSIWQTGRKSVRRLLLRQLRKTDPAQALSLITSTWSEEGAEEREAFLEMLGDGLSMADEPFLEGVLDDRVKIIRNTAAYLLARLPNSRLVKRHFERAQTLLKWKPGGFLRKPHIEVNLPGVYDRDMTRDGVEPKRLVESLGEKADWAYQILQSIPPTTWSKQWGKTPAELMEIAGAGDWKELLHKSWIHAARNHPDPDWAITILKIYPHEDSLLYTLPTELRCAFLIQQIKTLPEEGIELLKRYQKPWGLELTRLSIVPLRNYYYRENDRQWLVASRASFIRLGDYMDPMIRGEVAQKLLAKDEPGSQWHETVDNLLGVLDFRHQMIEELK